MADTAGAGEAGALGLIAGSGALPRLIAERRARQGAPYFVAAFEGHAPDWLADHPHVVLPFEKPGRLFKALRAAGVDTVAFAGGMARPKLSPLRFDMKAAALAKRIMPLIGQGDDALLRALAETFEAEGFRVVGAQDLLGGLLAPEGSIAGPAPAEPDSADIDRARALAAMVGQADVGQGAVVAAGLCLGLETLQGTDAMLRFVAETQPARRPDGARGVLYKGPKPGQDRRTDLPAIGPETARAAAAAGLSGIAVEAGGVLLLDRDALVAEAEAAGLFLWGVAP